MKRLYDKNLPSIFSDLKILLSSRIKAGDLLKRYIIALEKNLSYLLLIPPILQHYQHYDGEVIDEDAIKSATHIVVKDKQDSKNYKPLSFDHDSSEKKAITMIVSADWLWDSIKLQKLLTCKKYRLSQFEKSFNVL
ncbi:hypothetical protein B4U79_18373 [Dinothrombium tinctorium]|uniref:BRCT domain-containing protein n=1 Tax=Dinothrombium tinctorium TaxID=1965070 RepID=A0A3S3RT04_9ACAR|nr:hypothetical protein B4U79_18373 [Dinothrombium tinctorium]